MPRRLLPLAAALALVALACPPARANAYIPIEAVSTAVFLAAFLPICLIEAAWYHWRLGVREPRALVVSLAANLASSVLGVPLSWLSLTLVGQAANPAEMFDPGGYVLWDAAIPDRGRHLLYMLVHVLPAFAVSGKSESWVLGRLLPSSEPGALKRAVWEANAASYAFLYVLLYVLPVFGLPLLAELRGARP